MSITPDNEDPFVEAPIYFVPGLKVARHNARLEELRREFPSIKDDVLLERIKLENENAD